MVGDVQACGRYSTDTVRPSQEAPTPWTWEDLIYLTLKSGAAALPLLVTSQWLEKVQCSPDSSPERFIQFLSIAGSFLTCFKQLSCSSICLTVSTWKALSPPITISPNRVMITTWNINIWFKENFGMRKTAGSDKTTSLDGNGEYLEVTFRSARNGKSVTSWGSGGSI